MLLRRLRRWIGERPLAGTQIFERQRTDYGRAITSIKTFYLLTVLIPAAYWQGLLELVESGIPEPLWPVRFVLTLARPEIVTNVFLFAGVGAFLWILCAPGSRWARVSSFAGNLLVVSLLYSRGKIYHTLHAMLWMQFVFIFLPVWKGDGSTLRRRDRQSVLVTFATAQGLLLLFYSMSGVAKVFDGVYHLIHGGLGSFSPLAMAYQIAYHLTSQYHTPTLPQTFAMNQPLLGYPVYLITIYVQATALLVVAKPSLHRVWGTALILFHVGTKLFMGIFFLENTLILGVLLVNSPFLRDRPWRERLRELPVLGLLRFGR